MKILYPMQVGGGDAPKEVASLEEFIGMLNGEPGGTFLLGGNRIWHGGIHLSDKGGWDPGGAVRAIADGEIVAYRITSDPVSVTLEPEEGKSGEPITLHTSPSFCLIRHRYEATEEVSGQQQPKRNTLTFYCLYMHIACKNAYQGEPERHVLTGSGVAIYKATASLQFQKEDKLGTARKGAEVTLIGAPSERRNLRNEPYSYQLVSYAAPKGGDPSEFYIASQFIKEERKVEPDWMMAKQDIPSLYPISRNSYLRKSKDQGEAVAAGLPKTSKVARTTAQPVVFSNMKEYLEVEVWNISQGKLTDDKGNVVPNASKGDRYWIAKEMLGQPSDAVWHTPLVYDKVELRHTNPIPVKGGEVVGHWGEHETPKPTANGFVLNEDRKAIHMEIFVAESDKEALGKCISNEGKLVKGQEYLLLKEGGQADTYKLTKENNKFGYSKVGAFGPQEAPKPINTQDIVTHGADKFVKVAEDQHVLISGDTRLVSQHDWARLGVTLVDGGSDPDGFLDKADTDGKEGGDFFSTLYEELVTDRDGDGSISSDEIKAAMAEKMVADKVRNLFIKHESEWVKRDTWPRLEQELKNMPNLYKYVLEVTNKMAWIEQAAAVVGDTKPWFIHPAGMMGLIEDKHTGCACNRDLTLDELKSLKPARGISDERLQSYLDTFNKSFSDYSVTTCLGKAHFLAQVFHESGNLYYTKEIGGNTKSYSPWYGRGLIQITFRDNYQAYGDYVGEDFVSSDECREKLSIAPHAVRSAYWYIYVGRPACQKAFEKDDLLHSSFLVNGGLTHYIDRQLKINLAIGSFANPNEFVKNINGEYEFESSEIYNIRKGALAWGLWNDEGSGKGGANNSYQKALAGYRRFLTLLDAQPFTQQEMGKKWYGRLCRDWRGFVEQRIITLE
ncbi:glycoside hydrolase family 19 protein [Aeromonas sp.]|uniref:glycoside hydrolase family 19 protein n=1 Tax=Aeromonas sp. TaxID=647 RepID=UPI00291562C5|nr:glycoside hydrolase family 19 protein [Aeromonas sp.]MDU7580881.1 glycoside hydrolase family 19 protein [Aeromonas sp.]